MSLPAAGGQPPASGQGPACGSEGTWGHGQAGSPESGRAVPGEAHTSSPEEASLLFPDERNVSGGCAPPISVWSPPSPAPPMPRTRASIAPGCPSDWSGCDPAPGASHTPPLGAPCRELGSSFRPRLHQPCPPPGACPRVPERQTSKGHGSRSTRGRPSSSAAPHPCRPPISGAQNIRASAGKGASPPGASAGPAEERLKHVPVGRSLRAGPAGHQGCKTSPRGSENHRSGQ